MNFEGLTLAELKDMAKEKGVKNISKLKKEELIVALSNKETDKVEIKKEDKNLDAEIEKIELESLYKELETYNDYIEYKKNARIFNDLITNIQKKFEEYFNSFLI